MTRKQRQDAQPKFVPRQWPSDLQSIYLLARAERLRDIRLNSGREVAKEQAQCFKVDPIIGIYPTRHHFQLGR